MDEEEEEGSSPSSREETEEDEEEDDTAKAQANATANVYYDALAFIEDRFQRMDTREFIEYVIGQASSHVELNVSFKLAFANYHKLVLSHIQELRRKTTSRASSQST